MKFAVRTLLAAAALGIAASAPSAQTLNVITAGDQNMVDYVNNYLAPKFEAMNPGVKVRAVGTGPGDAGSQKRRRCGRAPARRRDDGQRKAVDALS